MTTKMKQHHCEDLLLSGSKIFTACALLTSLTLAACSTNLSSSNLANGSYATARSEKCRTIKCIQDKRIQTLVLEEGDVFGVTMPNPAVRHTFEAEHPVSFVGFKVTRIDSGIITLSPHLENFMGKDSSSQTTSLSSDEEAKDIWRGLFDNPRLHWNVKVENISRFSARITVTNTDY